MKKIWFTFTAASLLLLTLSPARCLAVNFFDGARAPKGLYFLTYSSLYNSRTTEYRKLEEIFRLSYYTPNLVLTALLPIGEARNGLLNSSSSGIGDMVLGGGYFLPVRSVDILPMLFVKLPTGEYHAGKSVNYGSNQRDIRPAVFLYKALGRFSVDAAAKYYFRERNPATHIYPGNELYLQLLLGWQCAKWYKAGPSINWMKSDTGRETFSLGGDIYIRLPLASVTFTYLHDAESRNTTKGDFFQIKTCARF